MGWNLEQRPLTSNIILDEWQGDDALASLPIVPNHLFM